MNEYHVFDRTAEQALKMTYEIDNTIVDGG